MPRKRGLSADLRVALDRANGALSVRSAYAVPGQLQGIAIGPLGYGEPSVALAGPDPIERAEGVAWLRVADRIAYLNSSDITFIVHLLSLTRQPVAAMKQPRKGKRAKPVRKRKRAARRRRANVPDEQQATLPEASDV